MSEMCNRLLIGVKHLALVQAACLAHLMCVQLKIVALNSMTACDRLIAAA
jgi:hypothetical protein